MSVSNVKAKLHASAAKIGQKPWKYLGWPAFSRFAASDDDFLVLRRFVVASIRVLLAMQDNVARLEETLHLLDEEFSSPTAPDVNNGSFREQDNDVRKKALAELQTALLEYSTWQPSTEQMLSLHSDLKSMPPASKQTRRNVETWLWNHPGAIVESETQFFHASDLINIVERRRSPLRNALENIGGFRSSRLFKSANLEESQEPQTITYYSDSRVDTSVSTLLLAFGLFMLICPLWILDRVKATHVRLAFISVSIVVFLLLVSTLTAARPTEAIAATAAYSAVLMVFMQMGPS